MQQVAIKHCLKDVRHSGIAHGYGFQKIPGREETLSAFFIFQAQFCRVHCGPLYIMRCDILEALWLFSDLFDGAQDGLHAEFHLQWAISYKVLSERKGKRTRINNGNVSVLLCVI